MHQREKGDILKNTETSPYKMQELKINIDGKEYSVKVEDVDPGKLKVHFEGETFEVETKSDVSKDLFEKIEEKAFKVQRLLFIQDSVKQGQKFLSLMAMKMENNITAPFDCQIKEVKVKKDDTVNKGDLLLTIG